MTKLAIIPFVLLALDLVAANPSKRGEVGLFAVVIRYLNSDIVHIDVSAVDALLVHDQFRHNFGARPLQWDENLAAGARSFAARCVYQHSQPLVQSLMGINNSVLIRFQYY